MAPWVWQSLCGAWAKQVCSASFSPRGGGELKAGVSPENGAAKTAPRGPPGTAGTPGLCPREQRPHPSQRLLPLNPLGATYVRSEYFPASGPPGGKWKADGLELKIK